MKALVTGAGGFLGRHLVSELAARGDAVAAVVRPSRADPSAFAPHEVELVPADLRHDGALPPARLDGVDVVYHLAASLQPPWRSMFEVNVTGTERLLSAIERAGWNGRFVHVSSFALYAFNQLPAGATVDEETPLEPDPGRRDDYAWTKMLQERMLHRLTSGNGVETVIVRPGTVYGREREFQHRVGRQLGEHAVLLIGGGNLLPLTYVENTASLLAECGRHPAAPGQVFNAVDPQPITQREYLSRWRAAQGGRVAVARMPLPALSAIWGAYGAGERLSRGRVRPPALLRPYEARPTLKPFRYAPSRAEAALGWRPPFGLEEALARTFGPQPASSR